MKTTQKGFTLIELMIVIAIIAILAAIAIPQYEHYIARSQASEALTITSGLKTDVINFWDQNGKFPTATDPGFTKLGNLEGKYVDTVKLTADAITATMKSTGVSKGLSGKTFTLTPMINGTKLASATATGGAISWVCTSDVTNPSDVPSQCRGTAGTTKP